MILAETGVLCCFIFLTMGSKPDQPLALEWKWFKRNDLHTDHRKEMTWKKRKDVL